MLDALPHRGDGTQRPSGLVLPPARMALLHARRPLKRWRYVGVYGPELMLCAGRVRIGGLPQDFWAVWDRGARRLIQHTTFRPGRVALPDGELAVRDGDTQIALEIEPAGELVEVTSRHGRSYIWTAKAPIHARGTVTVDGATIAVDAAGLLDDSAGYHARHTAWEWSAGVGSGAAGEALAWNLVTGIHDGAVNSERTVWVDARAHEVEPLAFTPGLDGVGDLRFAAECERARRDKLLVLASDYRQPFGTFSGILPSGVALADGFGVMERHRARW